MLVTPLCDLLTDLNGNGDIDIVDIMLVAVHWGRGVRIDRLLALC